MNTEENKLDETNLNKSDLEYIEKTNTLFYKRLWNRLNEEHYQYFKI